MSRKPIYKAGDVYGEFTLTGKSEMKEYGGDERRFVEIICSCGYVGFKHFDSIKRGLIKSCGCKTSEMLSKSSTIHGMAKDGNHHPIYTAWYSIQTRCYSEDSESYPDYGGRGIIVCDEWLNSFDAFKNWSLSNGWEKGLSI